jgi:hypothetical protein
MGARSLPLEQAMVNDASGGDGSLVINDLNDKS